MILILGLLLITIIVVGGALYAWFGTVSIKKRLAFSILSLVLLFGIVLLFSCSYRSNSYLMSLGIPLLGDDKTMTQGLLQRIPLGTPKADVIALLNDMGIPPEDQDTTTSQKAWYLEGANVIRVYIDTPDGFCENRIEALYIFDQKELKLVKAQAGSYGMCL